jgi:sugar lactone lactonase YvrE
VNQSYTPQARDAGYTLKAQVTAANGDGATVATTTASKALALTAPGYLRQFGEKGEGEKGQFNDPVAAAVDAYGDVWVVDHNNDRIQEWSSSGTWLHTYGKKGAGEVQFESPEGIAVNTHSGSSSFGDVYVADMGNNRIEELNPEGKYVRSFGKYGKERGELNGPRGVAIDSYGDVWVGDYGNNRVDEFSEAGAYLGSFGSEGTGNDQFKGPDGIAFSGGNAYVVDVGNDRVQEFNSSGLFVAKFGSKGTGEGQFETPYGIATEPISGDLYVGDAGNNRIEEFNPAGTFLVAFGKKGEGNGEFSSPGSPAVNSAGDVYVPDSGNNRVQELEPKYSTNNPAPEPPALGTNAVTTIDYNVPLSGSGLPTMTKAEVERWGQKDDPAEPAPGEPLATAVFPPDEPMGWPAKDYKRATISYYDELGRTVNVATPYGGVSTSEYNEYGDVIRTLSPANRKAALLYFGSSKEYSKLYDTESRYNGETKEEKEHEEKEGKTAEPGVRLLESLGPQHTVKLAKGKKEANEEALARDHRRDYYNEGAPSEGGPYDLVTKSIDGAETASKEEFDQRETTTAYSGTGSQENLGWKLRKPTSITTDPNGLSLTHTTLYSPSTGSVVETRTPPTTPYPTKESTTPPTYSLQFKPEETHGGPYYDAIDGSGNVWLTDYANGQHLISEFTGSGTFLKAYGEFGSEGRWLNEPDGIAINQQAGDLYVANDDQGHFSNEAIHEYSTAFEYKPPHFGETPPRGVAVDSSGYVWETTRGAKVYEYSSTGEPIISFGEKGEGVGQLKQAEGIAVWRGTVFVTDAANDRVVEFTTSGKYIREFGSKGSGEGQFSDPLGIAIDPTSEILYVVDSGNDRVQEFSTAGEYLTKFGSEGKENGQLKAPEGIAINSTGGIYVVVQSSCINGWYTGWVHVDLKPPPGYYGLTSFSSWSKASRNVTTCPS